MKVKKFRRAINWVGKLGLDINLWSVKDITNAIIKGVTRKRSKKNKGRALKDQAANISLFCNELPFFLCDFIFEMADSLIIIYITLLFIFYFFYSIIIYYLNFLKILISIVSSIELRKRKKR